MKEKTVLFLGETYTGSFTYIRGADHVTLPVYSDAKGYGFCEMLKNQGIRAVHMMTHDVPEHFPVRAEELEGYDAVILSDVGSNTMFKNPSAGIRANRLELLRQYVVNGGGLLMCGGYFSFSGIGNTARYGMTPLAEALPVEMLNYDDRMECPEGICPSVLMPEHPVLTGIRIEKWPALCGYNKVLPKKDSKVVAAFGENPFLVSMEYGKGRTFAFTSDCTPNWATEEFLNWEYYPVLFKNIIQWLTRIL